MIGAKAAWQSCGFRTFLMIKTMKILFICHGNICRSPMAELVLKHQLANLGLNWTVASAATSSEELGNPVYPPVRRLLSEYGIDCSNKRARRLTVADYAAYDLLIGMDNANMRNMNLLFGGDPEHKLYRLLDFTDRPGEVADPWYTGDFTLCYRQIVSGCQALLRRFAAAGD